MRVMTKQAKEEQEQVLMKFSEKKKEIEDQVDNEQDSLHLISHNCEGDIDSIGKNNLLFFLTVLGVRFCDIEYFLWQYFGNFYFNIIY